jgi:hypothetical protein
LPKGNDFLVFYVSGQLAADGRFDVLVDDHEFRHAQEPFLGPTSTVSYPAVYPPQIGLAFAPLSRLAYTTAYAIWAALTLVFIGWSVVEFGRGGALLPRYPATAIAVVLAFPPVPYLVLAGQISAVALVAIALAHRGLSRRSPVLGGIGVGLLGFKASLFFPALAFCILAGEWTMSAVALLIAALQTLAVVPIAGTGVVFKSVENLISAARNPSALAMRPYLMVSWRSFWALLGPAGWVPALYGMTAAATLFIGAAAWRRCRDPLVRVSVLSLTLILATPHLFLYDLVIAVPAFVLAFTALSLRRDIGLYVLTLMAFLWPLALPVVAWSHLQFGTVIVFVWLLLLIRRSRADDRRLALAV